MLERTKKPPTDEMVTLNLRVHSSNAERVKRYIASIEAEQPGESRPWREAFTDLLKLTIEAA